MVVERCIACNKSRADLRISCVCGHVFEHSKLIGGKRFSEYRVELYSRLENRRMKRLTREKKRKKTEPHKETQLKNNTAIDETASAHPPREVKASHTSGRSGLVHRRMKTKRFSHTTGSVPRKTVVPPELASRLPSALQEINRRLTGQNLMWWTKHLLQ